MDMGDDDMELLYLHIEAAGMFEAHFIFLPDVIAYSVEAGGAMNTWLYWTKKNKIKIYYLADHNDSKCCNEKHA